MMDREVLALSLLTGAETAHSFSSFLPSYFTIKSFALDGDPDQVAARVADLRSGYRPAVVFGIGLGAIVSLIARSPAPLLFAGAAATTMIYQYERALPDGIRVDNPLALLAGQQPPGLLGDVEVYGGAMG
jgi:hypothetical protein